MILTLIGYRGSGKSSVAAPLADALHIPWCDVDTEIETRACCSIREIFERENEAGFRRRERETIVELLQHPPRILAAGGGAILNADTRADFLAAGPVVWLQADVDTLTERIYGDPTTQDRRPNLTAQGGRAEVASLLEQRTPLYQAAASIVIDTEGRTVDEVVAMILAELPEQQQENTPHDPV